MALLHRFTVEKEEGRNFQQHFHLAKGAETLPNGQVRTHGEGGNLLVVPVRGLTGTLTLESNPHPIRSYANPDHAMIEWASMSNLVMAMLLAHEAAIAHMLLEQIATQIDIRTV